MYSIDDLVIYRRDVCRVAGRETSQVSGEDCYVLTPYASDDGSVRMLVPVSNKGGHLRDIITPPEAEALMERIGSIEPLVDKPANMKSQYVAMLRGDSIEDLIRVINRHSAAFYGTAVIFCHRSRQWSAGGPGIRCPHEFPWKRSP